MVCDPLKVERPLKKKEEVRDYPLHLKHIAYLHKLMQQWHMSHSSLNYPSFHKLKWTFTITLRMIILKQFKGQKGYFCLMIEVDRYCSLWTMNIEIHHVRQIPRINHTSFSIFMIWRPDLEVIRTSPYKYICPHYMTFFLLLTKRNRKSGQFYLLWKSKNHLV